MSYVRHKSIHPAPMGGTDEHESMYGGKRQVRIKTRVSKKGDKTGLAGMGIRAKAPGIMRKGSGHKF